MVLVRMENTGKVTGAFELDFDKREFSAVNVMDGWQTFAMGDVSKAVYRRTARRTSTATSEGRFLDAAGRQADHLGGPSLRAGGPDGGGDLRGGRPPEFLPGNVL